MDLLWILPMFLIVVVPIVEARIWTELLDLR